MKKNNRKPETRRKKLVEAMSWLFSEKSHEGAVARDIFGEVNGTPDIFSYYYNMLLWSSMGMNA